MNIFQRAICPAAALLIAALFAPNQILAHEGMWTFDNLPREQLKTKYDFSADQTWVDHVMRASVSTGGCSASFISPDGLVLTNHHCVAGCLQQISSAKKNYLVDGLLMRKREDELQCPAMELSRLEEITDVSKNVNAATKGLVGEAYKNAQNVVKARLASDCVGDNKATVRCSVVTLYQGGQYHLYRYHRFSDARLVWAPEAAASSFGGDPDNFNFPRYGLDAAILRAYENGKPAAVKDYCPLSKTGATSGELVFTSGSPGSTSRLLTVAQLETLRDQQLIDNLRRSAELRGVLTQYRKLGAEQARIASNDLFFLENGLKVTNGKLDALLVPELLNRKRAEEQSLRKFVAGNPALKAALGDPWLMIARAQVTAREINLEYGTIELARAFQSRYFAFARTLVRGADERGKADGERLPEFSNTRMPVVERQLFSPAPVYADFEKVKLEWSLTKMREWLGTDDPFVVQVLGRESPAQMAARLVDGTTLGDPAIRKALWLGDRAMIEKSTDPFIQLARAVDARARAIRKRVENEVTAVEQKSAELIAKARFAQLGSKVYPDATGTLRLSFGDVEGWMERGKPVPSFTDFDGAFKRHTGAAPYALPDSWLATKGKINLAQQYDFVASTDIIGGNSGSPMINRNAEIVGLAFDGNTHSHGGGFWFDPKLNRTVGVSSGGILETLKNIYGASELLAEITVR